MSAPSQSSGSSVESPRVHAMRPPAARTFCDRVCTFFCYAVFLFVACMFLIAIGAAIEDAVVGSSPAEASPPQPGTSPSPTPPLPPPPPKASSSGDNNLGVIAFVVILYGGVPFLAVLALVYTCFCGSNAVQRRLMRSVECTRMADLATAVPASASDGVSKSKHQQAKQNMARVVGRARSAGEHLVSPISKRECLWYAARAYYTYRAGKRTHTVHCAFEEYGVDMLLDDGSGVVVRVPLREWLRLPADEHDSVFLIDSQSGLMECNTAQITSQNDGGLPDALVRFLRRASVVDDDEDGGSSSSSSSSSDDDDDDDDDGGDVESGGKNNQSEQQQTEERRRRGQHCVDLALTPERNMKYSELVFLPGEIIAAAGSFNATSGEGKELLMSSPPTIARAPSLRVGPVQRASSGGFLLSFFKFFGSLSTIIERLDWARLGTRALISDVDAAKRGKGTVKLAEAVPFTSVHDHGRSVVVDVKDLR